MLLDEPLSNLDAKLREQMRIELRDLLKRVGMTAIYVTHDQEEAMMLSDRVALMNAGKLVEVGSPRALYLRPRTVFGATFLGAAEVLRVTRCDGNLVETEIGCLHLDAPTQGICFVAIRPEAMRVHATGEAPDVPNRIPCRIESVVFAGRQQHLVLRAPSGRRLNAMVDTMRALNAGASVEVELPPCRLMTLQGEDA
jgi:ABC-type Fe3+/spermidine/putrescine transport system ATPase subunit